jgi:DNA-directed RNA polymerase subunit RPC12/RpoP
MEPSYFLCRQCKAEFEMLDDGGKITCLQCGSTDVKARKNAKLNCSSCCSGCEVKDTCEAWKE